MWGQKALRKVNLTSFSLRSITQAEVQKHHLYQFQYDASKMSPAKTSVFRKRPTKFSYDKYEFHYHTLPSEKKVLFGVFDHRDVFGERKNMKHSPYIRAQLDLDTKLVLLTMGICFVLMFGELKSFHHYKILRANQVNSTLGRIELDNLQ